MTFDSVGNVIIPTDELHDFAQSNLGRKSSRVAPNNGSQSSCVTLIGSLRYLAGVPVQAAWACYQSVHHLVATCCDPEVVVELC